MAKKRTFFVQPKQEILSGQGTTCTCRPILPAGIVSQNRGFTILSCPFKDSATEQYQGLRYMLG